MYDSYKVIAMKKQEETILKNMTHLFMDVKSNEYLNI